ncbi:dihydrofolate reductase family protein [Paenalkalicoccus suaedae]|uniref:dihydrofolate reductase family protein n=1 Tax=Paenalkalicoccus suaedae TaxID=2592382 RepID=UPI00201BC12C|nr:dihydrofolate reductase family protein [Paenalkalicoccus suaedae]
MKRSVALFIATSLDGYIATEEETLEWLFEVEGEGDNGYSDFYTTVDTVLMGNNTYKWLMDSEEVEEYPYKDKESYVFTSAEIASDENVEFVNDPAALITTLKQEDGERIWLVGGGSLFSSFLEKGLVDEIIMTVAPKVIGEGIPLFQPRKYRANLELVGVQTFNQFVELHYKVIHAPSAD